MKYEAAVIGLGLIGGSIAAAMKDTGRHVVGYDLDGDSAETASTLGLIDKYELSIEQAVSESTVVVVAVPIAATQHVLTVIAEFARDDAVVLDTASVKESIVTAMEALPGADRFVGGHPMAGSEGTGPKSARADLFKQRPFALVPTRRTGKHVLQTVQTLIETLGAYPLVIEAARHDDMVARTSHMPYLASTSLALSCDIDDGRLAGPGLHDMVRLASSDRRMWREIAESNRGPILSALSRFRDRLDVVIQTLADSRWEDLDSLLLEGQDAASRLRARQS